MQGKSSTSSSLVVKRRNADGIETTVHVGAMTTLSCLFVGEGGVYMKFGDTATAASPPSRNLPRQEDVWEAVAKSIKDNKKKGMLRQAAIEKAIADNIDDVRALGLWRANKGRPNEGEPGSSWKACYQTLYDKGYLKQ